MAQTPISNMQASLALTEFFPTAGIFPSQGGGSNGLLSRRDRDFRRQLRSGRGQPQRAAPDHQPGTQPSSRCLATTMAATGSRTLRCPNLNGTTMVGTGQGPGLSPETIGEQSGSSTVTLHYGQTPANNLNPFGQSQSFDNRQPSLGITYEIATLGVFPTPGGGGIPLDTLGMIMAFAGTFDAGGYMACDGRLLSIAQYTMPCSTCSAPPMAATGSRPSRFRTCAAATSSAPRRRTRSARWSGTTM